MRRRSLTVACSANFLLAAPTSAPPCSSSIRRWVRRWRRSRRRPSLPSRTATRRLSRRSAPPRRHTAPLGLRIRARRVVPKTWYRRPSSRLASGRALRPNRSWVDDFAGAERAHRAVDRLRNRRVTERSVLAAEREASNSIVPRGRTGHILRGTRARIRRASAALPPSSEVDRAGFSLAARPTSRSRYQTEHSDREDQDPHAARDRRNSDAWRESDFRRSCCGRAR